MQKEDTTEEIIKRLQKQQANKFKFLIIMLFIIGIIIFLALLISAYFYFKTPEKTLGLGANIESALLSQGGKISYIKLVGGSLDKNITKIKFIFTDENGNENYYETSEGIKEIEVPFKRSFWQWLFGKPAFSGKYDYEINSGDIGLNDFNNINEISVSFEYKTETGEEVETPVLDTTKTTTAPMPSPGGGGGTGDGGTTPTPCSPNKDCSYYYNLGQCGTGLSDGCNNILNCNDCYVGKICINNSCVAITENCTDSDTGINYYEKGVIQNSTITKTDNCVSDILTEYYCNNTIIEEINYDCSLESKVCADGECVEILECSSNENCTYLDNTCAYGICNATGICEIVYNVFSDVCRAAVGECDVEEKCTGSSAICPANSFKDNGTSCSLGTCQGGICVSNFCSKISQCSNYTDEANCTSDVCNVGNCQWNATSGECEESAITTFDGWRVLPIRSEEEYNLGKIGGEAEQHPHGIARSPSNPNIIYLSHDVAQVWKSIDAGDTWKKTLGINLSLNSGQSIEVDPINPNIVFFIVSPAWNWLAGEYGGLYRSKDGGDTWEFILPMNVEVKNMYQHSIAYDPASVIGNQTMTWYVATIGDGLFRSDDGGNSWTESLGLKKEIKTNVFTQGYEDSRWPARLMFNGIYTDTSVLGLLNFKINYKFNETKNLDHIDFYQGDWQGTYDYAKELLIKFDDGSSMNATLEQLPWTKQTINLTGENLTVKQVQNMSITIISVYENPNPSVNWGGFAEIDVINDAGEDVTIWDEGISTIYDIKCHQTDGKTVYAGTDKGLYCSNNKGENMNPCGNLPSGAVSSIAINPQSPNMIYVVIRNNGLYRSLDGGNTFSLLRSFDATKVFINSGYPDVIYLVGINSNTIISHDRGATWITDMQTVPALGLGRESSWKGQIAGDLTGIVPNLNNENEAVAFSRATIWKTTDGGRYFNDSSTLFTGYAWGWWSDGIAFDPNNQDKFATFNCDVGMAITNNSGDYFDRRNDQAWGWYSNGLIDWIGAYSGDFQPIPGSQIIVASIGNYWNTQLMRTSDEGKNWELVTSGSTNTEQNLFIAFHPNDPNFVYAGNKISNNTGQNFSKVDFGAYNIYNPSMLGMCLSNPDTIYALDSDRSRILRSDDRGSTWYLYSQPGWSFRRLDPLPTFAADPIDCDKVYTLRNYDLAVFNGSAWRSTGVLALAGGSGLKNFVRAVAVDPNNNSIIYAGMHASGIPHIWRSQDNGYTWEDISYNLPRIGISAMAVNPHTGELMTGSAFGTWIFPPPYANENMIYDSGNAYSMPSCHDGLQNGDETEVDSGGSCKIVEEFVSFSFNNFLTKLLNFFKGLLTRKTGKAITGNAVNKTNENGESKVPYIILSLLAVIILIIVIIIVKIKKNRNKKKSGKKIRRR